MTSSLNQNHFLFSSRNQKPISFFFITVKSVSFFSFSKTSLLRKPSSSSLMASNTNSRKIILKISSSSSSSPKLPPTPSQLPPQPTGGVNMRFSLTHRSYYLNPEMKLAHDQVFTELPQSPHFTPLESFRSEAIKEGCKLGCDLAFLLLVQKLRNLNDSSRFVSEVDSLPTEFKEFEEFGYDLTKIKRRFNLLKRRAEEEQGWKNEVLKFEEEKQEKEESVEEKEFLLVELANESVKIAKEVKMERSEIERIENKKRKAMADLNVNEFEKLSNQPW